MPIPVVAGVGVGGLISGGIIASLAGNLFGGALNLGGIFRGIAILAASWARVAFSFVRLQFGIIVRGLSSVVSFLRLKFAVGARVLATAGASQARIFARDPKKLVAFVVFVRELVGGS